MTMIRLIEDNREVVENLFTRFRVRLLLFTLATCLLAFENPVNVLDSAYAKQARNEAINDKPLVEVTLRLEGKTVQGEPKVVSSKNTFDALFEKTSGTPLELKKISSSTWVCYGVEGEEYVIGWIVEKGWFAKKSKMFGYCSEPFTAHKGQKVKFSPGMPATFEYDLRNPPEGVKAAPAKVLLLKEIIKNGQATFFSWPVGEQEIRRPGILKIAGLAGGKYKISARTPDAAIDLKARTPVLYENREVEIKLGLVNRFDPVYPEIDSTVEEGDVTVHGTLYGPDKKPLADKTVQIIPLAKDGVDLSLYYPSSTTDSNGRFTFVGIRPNREVYIFSEDTSIPFGRLSLTENTSVSVDIVLGLKKLPVVIGEPMKEITVDWKDGSTGKLSDLVGKTVVLDVWATWCGPCKRAFPELNSLASELSSDSDIVFVALSIDGDKAIWEKMVDESDWKALRHGRLDRKRGSFVFNRPVPYSMIIDKNGIIRAEGNGLNIRLELDKLALNSHPPNIEVSEHSTEN